MLNALSAKHSKRLIAVTDNIEKHLTYDTSQALSSFSLDKLLVEELAPPSSVPDGTTRPAHAVCVPIKLYYLEALSF